MRRSERAAAAGKKAKPAKKAGAKAKAKTKRPGVGMTYVLTHADGSEVGTGRIVSAEESRLEQVVQQIENAPDTETIKAFLNVERLRSKIDGQRAERKLRRDSAIGGFLMKMQYVHYNTHRNAPVLVEASLMRDIIEVLAEAGYTPNGVMVGHNPAETDGHTTDFAKEKF